MMVVRGWADKEMGNCFSMGRRFLLRNRIISQNLLYDMILLVTSTVLCTLLYVKRIDLITNKKFLEVIDRFSTLVVVMVSWNAYVRARVY